MTGPLHPLHGIASGDFFANLDLSKLVAADYVGPVVGYEPSVNCAQVPCPEFTSAELVITAVCNCHGHSTPGNVDCPIHGVAVKDVIDQALIALLHQANYTRDRMRLSATTLLTVSAPEWLRAKLTDEYVSHLRGAYIEVDEVNP